MKGQYHLKEEEEEVELAESGLKGKSEMGKIAVWPEDRRARKKTLVMIIIILVANPLCLDPVMLYIQRLIIIANVHAVAITL